MEVMYGIMNDWGHRFIYLFIFKIHQAWYHERWRTGVVDGIMNDRRLMVSMVSLEIVEGHGSCHEHAWVGWSLLTIEGMKELCLIVQMSDVYASKVDWTLPGSPSSQVSMELQLHPHWYRSIVNLWGSDRWGSANLHHIVMQAMMTRLLLEYTVPFWDSRDSLIRSGDWPCFDEVWARLVTHFDIIHPRPHLSTGRVIGRSYKVSALNHFQTANVCNFRNIKD